MRTRGLWDSQPRLILGSSPEGWWDHGSPLLPGRQAVTGRALPALACTEQGCACGSKDTPALLRTPGRWRRVSTAASRLSSSARQGSLPSPAALQARGQESCGQRWCARRGRSARTSSDWRGTDQMPRMDHECQRSILSHTPHSQLLSSGWAQLGWSLEKPWSRDGSSMYLP